MKYKKYNLLLDIKKKYQHICSCGNRSIYIYPFENKIKKVCRICGNTVYINDKEKFKYKLMEKKKELDNEN